MAKKIYKKTNSTGIFFLNLLLIVFIVCGTGYGKRSEEIQNSENGLNRQADTSTSKQPVKQNTSVAGQDSFNIFVFGKIHGGIIQTQDKKDIEALVNQYDNKVPEIVKGIYDQVKVFLMINLESGSTETGVMGFRVDGLNIKLMDVAELAEKMAEIYSMKYHDKYIMNLVQDHKNFIKYYSAHLQVQRLIDQGIKDFQEGYYEIAISKLDKALKLAREHSISEKEMRILLYLGKLKIVLSEFSEALTVIDTLMTLFKHINPKEDEKLGVIWIHKAMALIGLNKKAEAAQYLENAYRVIEKSDYTERIQLKALLDKIEKGGVDGLGGWFANHIS